MSQIVNIYCDESCHLESDSSECMVVGAIWCRVEAVPDISRRLRELRDRHGLSRDLELKWTKVSPAKTQFYADVIDYFFDDDSLGYRGVIIPSKAALDHAAYEQSHHDWYYKMLFTLLEVILVPGRLHRIYLDIKDTHSAVKCDELWRVLRNANKDYRGRIVGRVQAVRSHESQLLQLDDLITGAISYANRQLETSAAKLELIERIRQRSGKSLLTTTWLRERKLNLLLTFPL